MISRDAEAHALAARLSALPAEVLSPYFGDLERCGIAPCMLDEALKLLLLKAYCGDLTGRVLCGEHECEEVRMDEWCC